jgi:hypothetical protein
MISKKKILSTMTLLALILTSGAGPAPDGPKISIQKTIETKNEMHFVIQIENSGPSSVFLEETSESSRDPYAINIEQLQSDSNWVVIGPRRDVPPTSLFELKPGAKVEKTVAVSDPYVDLRSPTHKQYPIRGQHRATVRYFLSLREWTDFTSKLREKPKLLFSQLISIN